ncbi:MAG: hypothetical protein NTY48_05585 [Candidatus Diapherotrites archaeon]|nr:hypothetical protein [Candidatus Diapherotrites archaeon]
MYKDFVLCEANHLLQKDFTEQPDFKIKAMLENNLRITKEAILRETKPGDLILVEAPINRKSKLKEGFIFFAAVSGVVINEELLLRNLNFYNEIAEYARKAGRVVKSVDSGLQERSKDGESSGVYRRLIESKVTHIKADESGFFAFSAGRNKVMAARIRTLKPKMVIVAEAHAAWIEHQFQPRKIILSGARHTNPWMRKEMLAWETEATERQKLLRNARRAEINKRLGLDKPRIKRQLI